MRALRERLGPGARRRRERKIARRRQAGKQPQAVQEPRDHESERDRRARIRTRIAERLRVSFDDPELAARAIRILSLPRTVKSPPKRKHRTTPIPGRVEVPT